MPRLPDVAFEPTPPAVRVVSPFLGVGAIPDRTIVAGKNDQRIFLDVVRVETVENTPYDRVRMADKLTVESGPAVHSVGLARQPRCVRRRQPSSSLGLRDVIATNAGCIQSTR